ncbi:hypothetical protein QQS21_000172 [Conoideocrella luteorostrata]|uniref:Uncharacterized protein n=1 Tax=Conoideocrella luteorostrata TaxID=1105319 RepID=A0AAJ0D015_9HYPO|nr:hypothetical protein QQS21_000172 [Conoideocrella luteorostrata]
MAAVVATPAVALPNDNVFARAGCNRDNCFRAVIQTSTRLADCSSYMSVTVTPCPSTSTTTSTITSTTTVAGNYPMKRGEGDGAVLAARSEAPACTAITQSPTALPSYATAACPQLGTVAPGARFSSACACNGVTAVTTTLPTVTSVVTATSTVMATATSVPKLFILKSTGDQSLYVTVDEAGALRLTHDTTVAVPFYTDNSGQLRNWRDPAKLFVDYYQPSAGTADNKVYSDYPSNSNFRLTCNYYGRNDGDFWGQCHADGPPNGNPVVYGFGTCPNEGYYVYMIPNSSNVRCYDGGYAFLGFFLVAYNGN